MDGGGQSGQRAYFFHHVPVLSHIVDGGMPLSTAMVYPRFHCSVGGMLSIEAERFSAEVLQYLEAAGYTLDLRESYSFYLGAVHAVMKCQYSGDFQGVAEIRRDGFAAGF